MEFKDAEISDIPELFDIFIEFEEQEQDTENDMFSAQGLNPLPLEIDEEVELAEFRKAIDDPKQKVIVAKKDGRLLGYATGVIAGKDNYDRSRQNGFFSAVAIRKEFRNQGIGSGLCDHIEDWLHKQGCASINIQCYCRNSGAKKLYEKRGYIEAVVILNKSLHNQPVNTD
jgi:GNAT superfamily N-acetyltransferase